MELLKNKLSLRDCVENIFSLLIDKSDCDFSISLPMPISVNAAYAQNGKKRVKSLKYLKWISESDYLMFQKPIISFSEPVAVIHNLIEPKDKRVRDCANYEKVATDYLVRIGVLSDDSIIRMNIQRWIVLDKKDKEDNIGIISMVFKLDKFIDYGKWC